MPRQFEYRIEFSKTGRLRFLGPGETTELLLKERAELKVILLTGHGAVENAEKAAACKQEQDRQLIDPGKSEIEPRGGGQPVEQKGAEQHQTAAQEAGVPEVAPQHFTRQGRRVQATVGDATGQ